MKPLPSDQLVGQYLQLVVYALAIVVCYVYAAGYTLGAFVHSLNNKIAKFIVPIITKETNNALQS